ncbi:hypothetical protein ABVT39_019831 [Epinephelus coioides]
MWPRFSLLIFCCAVSGLDALEADSSFDPSRGKMLGTEAAELGKPDKDAPPAEKVDDSLHLPPGTDAPVVGAEGRAQPPTAEPLEEEMDNQENVISQLLGDYDKVKTVSSGSDCVCRCIVRPIKRADCSRIHDSDLASPQQDFYTVETVTKGTDCKKCVCMAPPSAVNPCEGEYRFKKLQEASKDDIKLATIIDLLEGSLYGMDLLKINSVTTKLLTRVDNIEKAIARNFTERAREKERVKERAKEKEKEKKAQQKKKKVNDLERAGQKSGAAAYANKQKNYEGQLKKNQQQDGLEQPQPTRNKTGTQKPIKDKTEPTQPIKDKTDPKQPIKDKTNQKQQIKDKTYQKQPIKDKTEPKKTNKDKTAPTQTIKDKTEPTQPIKDKAEPTQPFKDKTEPTQPFQDKIEPTQPFQDKIEPTQPIQDKTEPTQPIKDKTEPTQPINDKIEPKQPLKDKAIMVIRGVTFYKAEVESFKEEEEELDDKEEVKNTTPPTTKSPGPSTTVSTQLDFQDLSRRPSRPAPTQQPTAPPTTTQQTTTTTTPIPTTTIKPTTELTTNIPPTTSQPTTTKLTTTSQQTTIQPTQHVNQPTTLPSDTTIGPLIAASPTAESRRGFKSRLVWTESPADQPKTTKKPAVCKDTVASISEPVQQNSYGNRDGAWMKDARGHGNVIYLTNGHYGNNLLEFRDMDTFKSGQASNSYKLPYSFTGTGHVVFSGAFYYNRAFSRDIIRYDLRHRYVAAWTTLHDALLEEQAHRTHTDVEFAVDESGLWLLYPALDTEGFHQEVILLIHLRPRDLQPIQTFRTGLRRGRYGNSFLVCGVLYAVDSMERHYANVTYAFDTHTLTHTVPSLAFTNVHAHTSQVAYSPLDKKLYAWDNSHQMTYDVIFAY